MRNTASLLKAVQVRHAAYARHTPAFAEMLRLPEPDDTADDCVVLLAESRSDGRPVGSMRIQTNHLRPLSMQRSICLPSWLNGKRLSDARRLAVAQGPDSQLVRIAVIKANLLNLQARRVDWSVVSARKPMNRMYERLHFRDILDGATFLPDVAPQEPHHVMAFEVTGARERWAAARHPLLHFMFETNHPDIDVGSSSACLGPSAA